jgi:hypothetical protein
MKLFSEMKSIKDVQEKTVQRWMEAEIKDCNEKSYIVQELV